MSHSRVGAIGVGGTVTANDKFGNHTGNAQQQHASHINNDECGTTILTGHVRETPYIAQSYGSTGRG